MLKKKQENILLCKNAKIKHYTQHIQRIWFLFCRNNGRNFFVCYEYKDNDANSWVNIR